MKKIITPRTTAATVPIFINHQANLMVSASVSRQLELEVYHLKNVLLSAIRLLERGEQDESLMLLKMSTENELPLVISFQPRSKNDPKTLEEALVLISKQEWELREANQSNAILIAVVSEHEESLDRIYNDKNNCPN
jgi:hypothetical protein